MSGPIKTWDIYRIYKRREPTNLFPNPWETIYIAAEYGPFDRSIPPAADATKVGIGLGFTEAEALEDFRTFRAAQKKARRRR